jgi:hypothetical protein
VLKYRHLISDFKRTRNFPVQLNNEGLNRLNDLIEKDKTLKKEISRLDSVNVYSNLVVKDNLITNQGIVCAVKMDSKAKINFEKSKKLIYGSLVCLSSDHFDQNLIIGTIQDKKATSKEDKKSGVVLIKLENYTLLNNEDLIANRESSYVYTMIETSSYFESYKHILQALQTFDRKKQDFPFQDYLIFNRDKNIKIPKYLQGNSIDFR